MEQFKRICKKLLFPHWLLIILVTITSVPALVWVFLTGREMSWIAYPIYVLAFYALTVLCIWLVPLIVRLAKQKNQKEASRDPSAGKKKLKFSLHRHLWINLVYGAGQILQGVWVGSAWVGANGIYNVAYALAYAILAGYERKLDRAASKQEQHRLAWKCFMVCGFALFGLNLTMTGIAFQMIWWGRGDSYSEIMVIAVAAFTFYKLTVAIIDVIKCRRNNSPILGAARNMELTEALMGLFSLQTALFASFGQEFDQQFLMNSLTGGAVCLSTMLGGIGMVIHGKRKMKESTGETEDGE